MKRIIGILAVSALTSLSSLSADVTTDVRTTTLIGRANKMLKDNNFKPAVSTLSVVLEESPENVRALRLRGNAHFAMENFSEALNDFSKIVQLQPKNARAYFERGVVHFAMGNDDLAGDDVEKAYVLNPEIEQILASKPGLGQKIRNLRLKSETSKAQVRHKSGLIDFKFGGLITK
ncbi:MAG: tetratricopeptide repeat protein [Chlamydiota bacterium]|nr:tetratricopeptide repeat protein [Chlamydiota bacterium]